MSYSPTTWTTGDTITATKMNKIEQGIAGAGVDYDFVIEGDGNGNFTVTTGTFNSVYTAMQTRPVVGLYKSHIVNSDDSIITYYVPISYVYYYPSNNQLLLYGIYPDTLSVGYVSFVWESDGEIYWND